MSEDLERKRWYALDIAFHGGRYTVKVPIKAGGVEIKTKALLQKTPEKGPK